MANIGKIIYKATGIMSKKQIMRTCSNIGNELSENLIRDKNINAGKIQEILTKNIGAKKVKQIKITDDIDSFKKFVKEEVGLTDEYAEYAFQNTKSAVIPGSKSNTSLLSLRIDSMAPDEIVNIATHEIEHVLTQRLGLRGKFEKLYLKIRGKKFAEKSLQKYGQLFNEKNMELQTNLLAKSGLDSVTQGLTAFKAGQEGLCKQIGLKTKDELDKTITDIIHKNALLPDGDKRNLKILKAIKIILKDEARAYKAGGLAEKNFLKKTGAAQSENITKSEMYSQLYDETIGVLQKEINKQTIDRLKNIIG